MQKMDILEKCAYIKGLAEGLNIDNSKPEGKVLNAIIDLLSDVCNTIADMDDEVATLGDYVEELDHDLGEVEEYVYEDDCDCDCDCDDDYDEWDDECDGNCDDCDIDCALADEDYFEVECPSCGETICFDGSIDPEELACPACGEKFECLVSEEDLAALDAE